MTRFAKYIVFLSALVAFSSAALPVLAQTPGDMKITTNTQLAVPGHLLEPGTYWFRRALVDDLAVYKIVAADGHPVGFVQVIAALRTSPAGSEVEVSAPDAAGVRLLQAWYGPGDTNGYELIYAKGDIRKLDQIAELQVHSSGYSAGQH